MDRKFAHNNVPPALAQKVSHATVQLLSKRDSYLLDPSLYFGLILFVYLFLFEVYFNPISL